MLVTARDLLPTAALHAFCRKFGVAELSLFGSVLRDDFGPESDVDVLIEMHPGHEMTIELLLAMQDELSTIFDGRPIDLTRKSLLRNPFRRHEILRSRELVYAA